MRFHAGYVFELLPAPPVSHPAIRRGDIVGRVAICSDAEDREAGPEQRAHVGRV